MLSGSPPPVIEAFPDHGYEWKPLPKRDIRPPPIPWPTIVAVVAVSIAVIIVAVAITVALTRPGGSNQSPTAAPLTTTTVPLTTPPSPVTATQAPPSTGTVTAPPPVTVTAPPPVSPAGPVPQNSELTSLQQLQAQANIDRPVVTGWAENRWVPQLSSKRPGTFDDAAVCDYNVIWEEHLRLRQRYGAKLLWSGDWSTFSAPDYWVTIAAITFPDSADAQAWCDNKGLDKDHCYPTLVH